VGRGVAGAEVDLVKKSEIWIRDVNYARLRGNDINAFQTSYEHKGHALRS